MKPQARIAMLTSLLSAPLSAPWRSMADFFAEIFR